MIFKKITAVFLALLTVISVTAVSVSAQETDVQAPAFKCSVKSETSTAVVVTVSLVSGGFNSLNMEFKMSSKISSCKSIVMADGLRNLNLQYMQNGKSIFVEFNEANTKIAIATLTPVDKSIELFNVTFNKKTTAKVGAADIKLVVTNLDYEINGKNQNLTSSVAVFSNFDTLKMVDTAKTLNYRASAKLEVQTTLNSASVKWTSSNTKVATVDAEGNVKAVGRGTAVIMAGTPDGAVTDECNVTVTFTTIQWIIYFLLLGFLWY